MDPLTVLARFDVDPKRVAAIGDALRPAAPTVAAALPALVAGAADPALALANWEYLVEATGDPGALETLTPDERADLFALLGGSLALANTVRGAGAGWIDLFRQCRQAPRRDAAAHAAALAGTIGRPWDEFATELRRWRNQEYLRIGLADLAGRIPVETTMAELSELAAGTFRAAYLWARAMLAAQFGELYVAQNGAMRPNGFVVIGMGKLGGGELNFSSDVDVMYLYESDEGASTGGPDGTVEPRHFFTRLSELITRALQEVTSAGFVFRVDLRLRPDGINGPIANSLANTLLYYESYGQTWERTALIQARPLAGTLELGQQFLREVLPFVYRRYLDYATVADMKAMKARVEASLDQRGRGNVKLGRGGVREIEFVAQVLQLINGGRDERVRGGGSLPTLGRLVAGGYLPADEGAELAGSYRFLRNVEHKIQIVQQRQTHVVPRGTRDQEALARRLGYRGDDVVAVLWADIDRHTMRVRRAFEKLFHEPAAETQRAGDPRMEQLLRALDARDASVERLRALGFADPQASYDNLLLLRDGPVAARARERRQRVLYEVAPALLGAILKSVDPDRALQNLTTFVSGIGARTSFLALLRENPGTLRMLVDLFASSQYLANAFIRHPEQLDSLVRADLVRVRRPIEDLTAELRGQLARAPEFEAALDVLRRFRNQEFLRIGINNLQGVLSPDEASAELSALADVCLRAASAVAADEVCGRYGYAQLPGRFVVCGLGKLGSGELNYNSDLDLIFVYDDTGADAAPLSPQELFSKFAQRLMTVLQTPTKEGLVYRIDTRLRPSGRSGPLVSSLEGFRAYHATSAHVWERQALIKARAVAGDPVLGERTEAIIRDFVYRAPLRAEEVREIRRLRRRMEVELARERAGRVNIKTGRGGLVDVEFVTQMLQLHYGAQDPALRQGATLAALEALAASGVLAVADHTLLAGGYRFLRRVENALRLAHDRPVEDLDRQRMDVAVVARHMGFGGAADEASAAFWREYTLRREAIRSCYDRWFDRVEASLR